MSYALLFPGQASQFVGMGRDLAGRWPAADRVYRIAEQASGLPLRRLCFEGPEDRLTRTANLQPAVVATSLAVLAAAYEEAGLDLNDRFPAVPAPPHAVAGHSAGDLDVADADFPAPPAPPLAVAGHSVGEYAALAAAGALTIAACLTLVAERGRLMESAAVANPGTMLALIGGDADSADNLCAAVRQAVPGSYLQVANHNSPGQTVIAGDLPGIDAARDAARDHGFRRALPIAVSGAFHSEAMRPAAAGLHAALEAVPISPPAVPLVANIDAEMKTDPDSIRAELAHQVTSPVRWADSIQNLAAAGVTTFLEIGPGNVLTRLTGRIVNDVRSESIAEAGAIPLLAAHLTGAEYQ